MEGYTLSSKHFWRRLPEMSNINHIYSSAQFSLVKKKVLLLLTYRCNIIISYEYFQQGVPRSHLIIT